MRFEVNVDIGVYACHPNVVSPARFARGWRSDGAIDGWLAVEMILPWPEETMVQAQRYEDAYGEWKNVARGCLLCTAT